MLIGDDAIPLTERPGIHTERERVRRTREALVAGRARPFGPPSAWDPMTSTLVFGESDAVLVDALTTAAEAEALAARVQLHHRNPTGVFRSDLIRWLL